VVGRQTLGAEPSRAGFNNGQGFHCVHLRNQSVTMRLLATGRFLRAAKGQWRYTEAGVGVCEGFQGSAGCARRHQSTSTGLLDFFADDQMANTEQIPHQREELKLMADYMSRTIGRTRPQISSPPYLDVYITNPITLSL